MENRRSEFEQSLEKAQEGAGADVKMSGGRRQNERGFLR